MNRKAWLVMLFALCLAFPALAQKITVRGTVTDSTGEPLIGASVLAKGTTSGTATDFDGNFEMVVDAHATLVVSYVGCETQNVAVGGRNQIAITLKDNSVMLDEVVAIGYGTVKKEDSTGSVSTVKPSEIQAGLATSAQDLLVGQTPGVVVTSAGGPDGSATIRIRGGSSLSASNDPLIVIDGVPMDNNGMYGIGNALSMVAPDNIENMTVLKDASATAIYGSRASNGVIIITTKKGKSGRPQVNFTANMYINTAAKKYKLLNASEYRSIVEQGVKDGYVSKDALSAMGNSDTNWQDQVLRTSVSHDYNLSVGGQVGFLPYRVSASYTGNKGIIKNNSMDRVTAGFNLSPKFFNGLLSINMNVKGYFIKSDFTGNTSALGAALSFDPTQSIKSGYNTTDNTGHGYTLFNGYTSWINGGKFNTNATNNPVSVLNDCSNKAEAWGSNGNLQIDYALHFFKDLHLNLNLGYDVVKSTGHQLTTANSPLAWQNNKSDGAATDYCEHEFKSNTLLDFYLNYRHEWDGKSRHNLDITAGYSWQRFYSSGWNNGTLFTSPGLNISQDGDNYFISEGTDRTGQRNSDVYNWANHLQLLSFFGRVNYTLQNRYLITATVRGDASSRFSKKNRWGVFPSVALAWKISEEHFFEGARDVMNELKLRAGWGITGQQDIGSYYPYLATYTRATIGSYYPGLTPATAGTYIATLYPNGYDSNLKWESTTTWNVGLDFGFLNNRITAAIDYYFRNTKDLLSYVTVPVGSATTNAMNQNIGSLENQGIEFSLTARPVVTKDFTWTLTYNVAYNKNKITKLNNDGSYIQTGGISAGTGNTVQVHQVGYPAYSFLVYQQVYDQQGNPIEGQFVDQNGDGVINDKDLVISHSKDPKVTMTFGSTFNYKGWDFGFALRANIGNYVYNDIAANRSSLAGIYTNSNLHNLIKSDFYFKGNTTANVALSDYWLRNASFLRCDNITVGYTWKNILKSDANPLRLRLYGAVQNPFVITKYNGIDPEVSSGIDNSVYPRALTVSLGVVATF